MMKTMMMPSAVGATPAFLNATSREKDDPGLYGAQRVNEQGFKEVYGSVG